MNTRITSIDRIRSLGAAALSMLVLALIVFAGNARAASPEWEIEGALLGGGSETQATESTGAIDLEVEGLATIECSKISGTGRIAGPKSETDSLSLTGCVVSGLPACTVRGVGNGAGTISLGSLAAELRMVGPSALYEIFTPASGKTFVESVFEGGSCSISNTYPLTGSFAASVGTLGTQSVNRTFSFSKSIEAAAGAALKFGKKSMFIMGSATSKLTGGNAGKRFGAR